MANEFYTLIVVPHAKARFRKLQVSVRLMKWAAGVLGTFSLVGLGILVHYTRIAFEVHELRQLALRRFYSRPAFLLRQLLRLRNFNDLRAAASGVRSLFWLWVRRGLFRRRRHPAAPVPAEAAATPARAPDTSAG